MSEIDTTLMMATYNRWDLTERMLDNLWKVTKRPFNLIIIDNGSTDGTIEKLKSYEFECPIHIVYNESNKGIAIARNQSLKLSREVFKTHWFCTIDNDVELPENWLNQCIKVLTANKHYGCIGVNMENKPYNFIEKNGVRFQDKARGNLGTACMVFPLSIHQMLGYFNTEYGPYGEEDADFGMRVRVTGFKLGYIEEMGNHFGVGEADKGEYREFKTACHNKNLSQFNENCRKYAARKKPLYIGYKE